MNGSPCLDGLCPHDRAEIEKFRDLLRARRTVRKLKEAIDRAPSPLVESRLRQALDAWRSRYVRLIEESSRSE